LDPPLVSRVDWVRVLTYLGVFPSLLNYSHGLSLYFVVPLLPFYETCGVAALGTSFHFRLRVGLGPRAKALGTSPHMLVESLIGSKGRDIFCHSLSLFPGVWALWRYGVTRLAKCDFFDDITMMNVHLSWSIMFAFTMNTITITIPLHRKH
jgi:hypothetical protein